MHTGRPYTGNRCHPCFSLAPGSVTDWLPGQPADRLLSPYSLSCEVSIASQLQPKGPHAWVLTWEMWRQILGPSPGKLTQF